MVLRAPPIRFTGARRSTAAALRLARHRASAAGTDDAPLLKRRAVVGSFLFRRHEDGVPRVALFKRSDKVNTYKHKWATISGGVEPDDASPLKAALRELYEETLLTPASLRYLCHGKPYSFVDNKEHYVWSVYPFAFHWPSDATEPLVLGWEHEDHAWFRPHEIPESDASAGLVESLRRVWPEGALGQVDVLCRYCLGEALDEETRADARRDAAAAFRVFSSTVKELMTSGTDELWRQVRLAAWHVWNHSDQSVKGPLLKRLLPGLELLEQLLERQYKGPSPQSRRRGFDTSESDLAALTKEADRFFSELWELK